MRYTEKEIRETASKYQTRTEFKNGDTSKCW